MAVLNELKLQGVAESHSVNIIKSIIAREFWIWFEDHREDKIVALKKIIFFSVTIKVKHLEPLFTLLFGAKP